MNASSLQIAKVSKLARVRTVMASLMPFIPLLYVLYLDAPGARRVLSNDPPFVVAAGTVAFLTTPFLIYLSRLSAQVFVRGVWWSTLLASTLLAVWEPAAADKAIWFSLPCAAALLLAGRRGLTTSDRFHPIAYQNTLLAMLVMAAADTCTLLFWGGAAASSAKPVGYAILSGAALMAVACYGLFRLKGWAVLLNLVANIAIAGLACAGIFDLPDPLRVLLTATAVGQLIVSAPLIKGIFTGTKPKVVSPARAALISSGVVFILAALNGIAAAVPQVFASL